MFVLYYSGVILPGSLLIFIFLFSLAKMVLITGTWRIHIYSIYLRKPQGCCLLCPLEGTKDQQTLFKTASDR